MWVNSKWREGGRISRVSRSVIRPLLTSAMPTEHALSLRELAVSKSIAAKLGASGPC